MKRIALILSMAALAVCAEAQTAPKSSSHEVPAKPQTSAATAFKSSASATASEPWIRLPPGVPRVVHGPVRVPFSLRYEDIKVGAGPEGEPNKVWHIKYTGWRAADGVQFDTWADHKQFVIKDGKPEMGPDGKPVDGRCRSRSPIPQGVGRVIPGFDWGLAGMRIGGKRRIFIPWQLAYGTHEIPDRPDHPGHSGQVRPHLRRGTRRRDRHAAAASHDAGNPAAHWRKRAAQRKSGRARSSGRARATGAASATCCAATKVSRVPRSRF